MTDSKKLPWFTLVGLLFFSPYSANAEWLMEDLKIPLSASYQYSFYHRPGIEAQISHFNILEHALKVKAGYATTEWGGSGENGLNVSQTDIGLGYYFRNYSRLQPYFDFTYGWEFLKNLDEECEDVTLPEGDDCSFLGETNTYKNFGFGFDFTWIPEQVGFYIDFGVSLTDSKLRRMDYIQFGAWFDVMWWARR